MTDYNAKITVPMSSDLCVQIRERAKHNTLTASAYIRLAVMSYMREEKVRL